MKKLILLVTFICMVFSNTVNAKIKLNKIAKQKWIRVETPNLNIITDTTPELATKLAVDLEYFNYFITAYLKQTTIEGVRPTIIAISKSKNFKALDLPKIWAGVFVNNIDGAFAVANIEGYKGKDTGKNSGLQTIRHEYIHYVAHSTTNKIAYPLWYSEGMAEYLSTFKIEEDNAVSVGRIDLIGRRALSLIKGSGNFKGRGNFEKIDIEDLLKSRSMRLLWRDEKSEHKKRLGREVIYEFYARAVFAYHYLHSSKELINKTSNYIRLLNEGYNVDGAFNIAFEGTSYEQMDSAIKKYMKGNQTRVWKYSVGKKGINFPQVSPKISKLDAKTATSAITQELLKLSVYKYSEKKEFWVDALSLAPNDPNLLSSGLVLDYMNDPQSIKNALEKALKFFPKNSNLLTLKGGSLLNRAYDEFLVGSPHAAKSIRDGRNILRKVIQNDPYNARAYGELARIAKRSAENDPQLLDEACYATETARLLAGDRISLIRDELYCSMKLERIEHVIFLLRKYATIKPNNWISNGYGRYLLDAYNLRALALTKPKQIEANELTYKDGSVYKGQHEQGVPNGTGTFTMPEGISAKGIWVNGKLEGKGVFFASNSYQYQGEFKNGIISGQGRMDRPEGNNVSYSKGEFLLGMENGRCLTEYSTGITVEGTSNLGIYQGMQTITRPDGTSVTKDFAFNRTKIKMEDGSFLVDTITKEGKFYKNARCYQPETETIKMCKAGDVSIFQN